MSFFVNIKDPHVFSKTDLSLNQCASLEHGEHLLSQVNLSEQKMKPKANLRQITFSLFILKITSAFSHRNSTTKQRVDVDSKSKQL